MGTISKRSEVIEKLESILRYCDAGHKECTELLIDPAWPDPEVNPNRSRDVAVRSRVNYGAKVEILQLCIHLINNIKELE